MSETGFTPPPFDAAAALEQLKRQLRDLKLRERGTRFELKGHAVVDLALGDARIDARIAKRAAMVPQWTAHALKSGVDVRSFVDTVKRHLAGWSADE